jgi:hypothetical protein
MFKVTITKISQNVTMTRKEWKPLVQQADGKVEYGYAPQESQMEIVEEEIFRQIIPDLLVWAVIQAVNTK